MPKAKNKEKAAEKQPKFWYKIPNRVFWHINDINTERWRKMEKVNTFASEDEKYEKMWFEHAKRMHNELKSVNGIIRDADTILNDVMQDNWNEFHEQSGVADELFSIYEQAADKNTFRQMFKLFVGCEFDEYCQSCVDVMEKYEASIL